MCRRPVRRGCRLAGFIAAGRSIAARFTSGLKQYNGKRMKKTLCIFGIVCGLLALIGVGAAVGLYMWAARDLPGFTRIADYRPALTTTILARDGSVLGYFYRENRFLLSLDDMPKMLPLAFLAAEDAGFYQHKGVDLIAIVRAFLANIKTGREAQGGSTITQQLIKRLLLTPERTYERKLKEAILAYRLERYLTKDEILTIYLNQTFLGSNAYGVEAAARTFFAKHAKDLTLAECALLAGLPQAPSAYNPYRRPAAAKKRQTYVLGRLHEVGWISDEEYQAALEEPLVYKSLAADVGEEGAWYLEEVRRRLVSLFSEENARKLGLELPLYGEDAVYELGFTVRTAVEPKLQGDADKALKQGLELFDRRLGWRGPVEKIPAADLEKRLAEETFTPARLADGAWSKAIVTAVTEKNATVRLGPYTGLIDVSTMRWARKPNPRVGSAHAAAVKDARKVLEVGDVVWVAALGPNAETPYDPAAVRPDTIIPLALRQKPEVQGALVSIETQTGDVVAMSGGYDFQESQFNRVTQAHRQPGSSFKPVVYSAALDNGFTAASVVLDAPVVEFMDSGAVWRPGNYEKSFKGPMLLRTALALSRNLVTIRVAQEIGISKVIERAKDLELEADFPEVLAVSLGAVALTPLNLTQAYTSFANGGQVSKARFILSVRDFWGTPLYEAQPDVRDAISAQNAFIMASMLKDVVNAGTGGKAKVLGRPVAGKTGTSNEEKDAWFVGFTPYLATGVYVGYDQVRPMGRDGSGSSAALPIFVNYAREAFSAYPPDDFEAPEGISFARVDAASGYLAGPGSARALTLPFYTGSQPGPGGGATPDAAAAERGEDLLKQLF